MQIIHLFYNILLLNNNILMEKLRGVEMKISVIQETLITQKFGDPDKYFPLLYF